MSYQIINNLPIDLNFFHKSKAELKLYGEWFFCYKQQRLIELINSVLTTNGFENWEADYSPSSLEMLSVWFKNEVKTEKLSNIEYQQRRASVPDWIEINDYTLTIETYSKAFDIGIYFGEVFIKTYSLQWKQLFTRKDDVDNGHIVIEGFGKLVLNPIWLLRIQASKIADGIENPNFLFHLYNTWCNYLSKT
jgi:hypothetical protein